MTLTEKDTGSGFDHLAPDDHERRVLEGQVTLTPSSAGYFALFRYATLFDRAVFVVSIAACMAAGAGNPLMMASFSLVPTFTVLVD